MILGNDLAVVTRSMKAKEEAIKEQGKEEIGLSGTFLENIDRKFEERNKEKVEKALVRNESRNVKGNIPGKQKCESKSVISRQNLIKEQSNKELLDLFKIALTPVEAENVSVGYLIKDNILMRKWSPTECDNGEKGKILWYQQYTNESSLNWHTTCQCLVILGYVNI